MDTVFVLEIPEELAQRLGPKALRMSREALGLEAHRQGLWEEAELGQSLGLSSLGWTVSSTIIASIYCRGLMLEVAHTSPLSVLNSAAHQRRISPPEAIHRLN